MRPLGFPGRVRLTERRERQQERILEWLLVADVPLTNDAPSTLTTVRRNCTRSARIDGRQAGSDTEEISSKPELCIPQTMGLLYHRRRRERWPSGRVKGEAALDPTPFARTSMSGEPRPSWVNDSRLVKAMRPNPCRFLHGSAPISR